MGNFLIVFLIFGSISAYANLNNEACLKIDTFYDLASFSDFDPDVNWSLANVVNNPEDLSPLDSRRLKAFSSEGGISFILNTGFDNIDTKLSWDTFKIDGTNRSYDIFLYEAGGNGSGFISEVGSHEIAATISDGMNGEISGCIKY